MPNSKPNLTSDTGERSRPDGTARQQAEAALRESEARAKVAEAVQVERQRLQELVNERTAELRATNSELTRFNEAMVGRELRMIELKQEIDALCAQLGQPPRYGTIADGQALPTP